MTMKFARVLSTLTFAAAANAVANPSAFVSSHTKKSLASTRLSKSDWDVFNIGDMTDQMMVTLTGKKDRDPSEYEQDLLKSKARLDKLMHTKNFRHALDSEDKYDASTSAPHKSIDTVKGSSHFEFSTLKQKKALDNLMQTDEFLHNLDTSASPKSIESEKGSSHFEFSTLKQKKALNDLMQTDAFRHSLDSDDTTPEVPGVHEEDHSVHHFELSMLEAHAALDKLMDSDGFLQSLEVEKATDTIEGAEIASIERQKVLDDQMRSKGYEKTLHSRFDYTALKKRKVLDDLMQSKGFRHNLDSEDATLDEEIQQQFVEGEKTTDAIEGAEIASLERQKLLDDQMQSRGYEKTPHSRFEYATLKKRKALDDLMQSKGFRHNLDSEDATLDEETHSKNQSMEAMLKSKAALDAVMGGDAFRKGLEADAGMGIIIEGAPKLTPIKRTHNDITSHFEFATLKKRAALEKLSRAKELRA